MLYSILFDNRAISHILHSTVNCNIFTLFTSLYLGYNREGSHLMHELNGQVHNFTGNNDRNTKVYIIFLYSSHF